MLGRSAGVVPAGVTVHQTRAELETVGSVLEPLLLDTGAPVTAQWWWVSEWLQTHPQWSPLGVVVRDADTVVGGAVLASRRRLGITEIVPAGFGQSDYPWLPAAAGAADAVAAGVAAALRQAGPFWRFLLYEMPEDDPVLTSLAARLRHCDLFPGVGAPVIDLPGYDMRRGISANARKRVRQSRNRLAADGRVVVFDVIRTPDELNSAIDEVQALHISRDHDARGHSDLDVPEQRAFWRAALHRAAARGSLEIAVMRIDGELAAHLIAFVDGRTFRVWDARMAPAFGRYTPGHLIRDETLIRLLADGRFDLFDWMRGLEPYKLQSSTRVIPTSRLRAWSNGGVAAAERLARRVLRSADEQAPVDEQ